MEGTSYIDEGVRLFVDNWGERGVFMRVILEYSAIVLNLQTGCS